MVTQSIIHINTGSQRQPHKVQTPEDLAVDSALSGPRPAHHILPNVQDLRGRDARGLGYHRGKRSFCLVNRDSRGGSHFRMKLPLPDIFYAMSFRSSSRSSCFYPAGQFPVSFWKWQLKSRVKAKPRQKCPN